ncbi:MAG TPA: hypothetical protein VE442_08570 [Jatrophihabitans sp.]|jgi:hypothetical protein|nr:hypothetical protein [Jatrophihabitans sp.]
MKQLAVASAIGAVVLTGGLMVASAAPGPATSTARPATTVASSVTLGQCPTKALPLTAESVARAADQARIEAPALYKGFGRAVVELTWRARFRLNVWASTPFHCSAKARHRTVVVDLLFPKMRPSASLSEAVVFVSRFPSGYRVWATGH